MLPRLRKRDASSVESLPRDHTSHGSGGLKLKENQLDSRTADCRRVLEAPLENPANRVLSPVQLCVHKEDIEWWRESSRSPSPPLPLPRQPFAKSSVLSNNANSSDESRSGDNSVRARNRSVLKSIWDPGGPLRYKENDDQCKIARQKVKLELSSSELYPSVVLGYEPRPSMGCDSLSVGESFKGIEGNVVSCYSLMTDPHWEVQPAETAETLELSDSSQSFEAFKTDTELVNSDTGLHVEVSAALGTWRLRQDESGERSRLSSLVRNGRTHSPADVSIDSGTHHPHVTFSCRH